MAAALDWAAVFPEGALPSSTGFVAFDAHVSGLPADEVRALAATLRLNQVPAGVTDIRAALRAAYVAAALPAQAPPPPQQQRAVFPGFGAPMADITAWLEANSADADTLRAFLTTYAEPPRAVASVDDLYMAAVTVLFQPRFLETALPRDIAPAAFLAHVREMVARGDGGVRELRELLTRGGVPDAAGMPDNALVPRAVMMLHAVRAATAASGSKPAATAPATAAAPSGPSADKASPSSSTIDLGTIRDKPFEPATELMVQASAPLRLVLGISSSKAAPVPAEAALSRCLHQYVLTGFLRLNTFCAPLIIDSEAIALLRGIDAGIAVWAANTSSEAGVAFSRILLGDWRTFGGIMEHASLTRNGVIDIMSTSAHVDRDGRPLQQSTSAYEIKTYVAAGATSVARVTARAVSVLRSLVCLIERARAAQPSICDPDFDMLGVSAAVDAAQGVFESGATALSTVAARFPAETASLYQDQIVRHLEDSSKSVLQDATSAAFLARGIAGIRHILAASIIAVGPSWITDRDTIRFSVTDVAGNAGAGGSDGTGHPRKEEVPAGHVSVSTNWREPLSLPPAVTHIPGLKHAGSKVCINYLLGLGRCKEAAGATAVPCWNGYATHPPTAARAELLVELKKNAAAAVAGARA